MIEARFERAKHYVADLKPAPFDRSGTQPKAEHSMFSAPLP